MASTASVESRWGFGAFIAFVIPRHGGACKPIAGRPGSGPTLTAANSLAPKEPPMTALPRIALLALVLVPLLGLGRHRPHLRHQQRRRQHPCDRSGHQQGGADLQGPRGDARHQLLAGRRAGLCQQRVAIDPGRVRPQERQADQADPAEQPAEQHRGGQGRPRRGRHRPRRRRARHHRPRDPDGEEDHPGPRPAAQRLCHAGQQIRHHRLDPEQPC